MIFGPDAVFPVFQFFNNNKNNLRNILIKSDIFVAAAHLQVLTLLIMTEAHR